MRVRLLAVATFVGACALVSACSSNGSPDQPSSTSFGTTINGRPDETIDESRIRVHREMGEPPIVRLFSSSMPPPWAALIRSARDADVVVSFKADPVDVLSGAVDARLSRWFASAPTDRVIYWIYYHEPEDNIEAGEFTAEEFVAAWSHIESLADSSESPGLRSTLVLMCWTLEEVSGRDWADYMPAAEELDVLSWDCYNRATGEGEYTSPERLFDESVQVSEQVGAKWAVAELGSELAAGDDGHGRAQWLRDVAEYARANDAAFVTYFHALYDGTYELSDPASQRAWRRIMSGRKPGFRENH